MPAKRPRTSADSDLSLANLSALFTNEDAAREFHAKMGGGTISPSFEAHASPPAGLLVPPPVTDTTP